MKLHCQRCGIQGSADLAFVWYAKKFEVAGSGKRDAKLWLCPDCTDEFATDRARDEFLRSQLREKS
jgi:hypothetical protein